MDVISYRDAVFNLLQYLDRNNLGESARTLERETGLFFSLPYFEECFIHGAFDEAEEYFNGFTTVHDNISSTNVVLALRWYKFLEALNDNDYEQAHTILHEELTTFVQYNENLIVQATEIMNMENFRCYELLRDYGDPIEARTQAMVAVRGFLEGNPRLAGKIRYQILDADGGGLNRILPPPPFPAFPPRHFMLVPRRFIYIIRKQRN